MQPGSGVPIELDRERRIRYPMAAVREIEQRFEADLMGGEGVEPDDVEDVVWLIYLGLQYGEPEPEPVPIWTRAWRRLLEILGVREPETELTEELVAREVDLANMEEVLEAVNRAMGGTETSGEVAPPAAGKTPAATTKAS